MHHCDIPFGVTARINCSIIMANWNNYPPITVKFELPLLGGIKRELLGDFIPCLTC